MSRLVISRLRSRMLVSSKFEIYVMHLAMLRVCPLRGKCLCAIMRQVSLQPTLERAGYRARDDVVTEARDPTAEAAVSVSATSQKVDLHDNQLDELTQSQSTVTWVLARVPPVVLPGDASVDCDSLVGNVESSVETVSLPI